MDVYYKQTRNNVYRHTRNNFDHYQELTSFYIYFKQILYAYITIYTAVHHLYKTEHFNLQYVYSHFCFQLLNVDHTA